MTDGPAAPPPSGSPRAYAAEVERLVDPISVGSIHFVQPFNGLLPRSVQRRMMDATAKKSPLMAFVVEPYSSFLCYEITDLEGAQALLPSPSGSSRPGSSTVTTRHTQPSSAPSAPTRAPFGVPGPSTT